MSVVATLYPSHRLPTGDRCPNRADPLCLLVCLPPPDRHPSAVVADVVDRLHPHATAEPEPLSAAHFPLWRRPGRVEASDLVASAADLDLREPTCCAGGPIGLLDLDTTLRHRHASAARQFHAWCAVVDGTAPAKPWSHFFDAHNTDPAGYPVARAITEFETQPRIAAIAAAGRRFGPDMYGPGLEALQAGPDTYATYRAGLVTFTDGLLTLDRRLMTPSFSPVLIEQTLPERETFHDLARRYLAALHPATLLVAVRCLR